MLLVSLERRSRPIIELVETAEPGRNDTLWEGEKERLTDALCKRLEPDEENWIHFKQVAQPGFPEFFVAAARAHARTIVDEEDPVGLKATSRFKLEIAAIEKQVEALKELLITQTRFTKEEVLSLASSSVRFQFDVIVRPRQTLEQSLFQSANLASKEDILIVAKGFGESRPFVGTLIEFVARADAQKIDRDQFLVLIDEAEGAVYKDTPITALLSEIHLILDFEASVTGNRPETISQRVLIGLLMERRQVVLADELSKEQQRETWNVEQIERALERFFLLGPLDGLEDLRDDDGTKEGPPALKPASHTISFDEFEKFF